MRLERLFPLLVAAAVSPLVLVLVIGAGGRMLPALAWAALVAGGAVWWRRNPSRVADVRWGAGAGADRAAVVTAATGSPRAARGGGSVAVSLARIEARELATSGWIGAGLGLCVFFLVAAGVVFVDDFERSWWGYSSVLLLFVHPLCGFAVVGAHRAVTRGARDGVEELLRACPAGSGTRARAHLASGVVVVVTAAVAFALGLTVLLAARNHTMYGPFDRRVVADLLLVPVLAFAAVALGVALGRQRWARWSLVPVLVVVAVAVAEQALFDAGAAGGRLGGLTAFGIWSEGDPIFFEARTPARLVWFAGLGLAVAGLALAPRRRTAAPLRLVAAGLAVALAGAVAVVRPLPDATADRLAAYVAAPGAHETCRDVEPRVRVCVLTPYAGLADVYAATVGPVAGALPEQAFATPVTMRTLFDGRRPALAPEVKDRLPDPLPEPPAGTVRLSLQHTSTHLAQARFRLAAEAVGLPTEPPGDGYSVVVAGQARGVLVLWYAVAGLSRGDALSRLTLEDDGPSAGSTPAHEGDVWPAYCREERPLQWGPGDLAAARSMLDLPPARVNRVLAEGWARWTSPSTPTGDLLAALGLPASGTTDHVEALPTTGC